MPGLFILPLKINITNTKMQFNAMDLKRCTGTKG